MTFLSRIRTGCDIAKKYNEILRTSAINSISLIQHLHIL